jgi:hypothetical protein
MRSAKPEKGKSPIRLRKRKHGDRGDGSKVGEGKRKAGELEESMRVIDLTEILHDLEADLKKVMMDDGRYGGIDDAVKPVI